MFQQEINVDNVGVSLPNSGALSNFQQTQSLLSNTNSFSDNNFSPTSNLNFPHSHDESFGVSLPEHGKRSTAPNSDLSKLLVSTRIIPLEVSRVEQTIIPASRNSHSLNQYQQQQIRSSYRRPTRKITANDTEKVRTKIY